MKDKGNVVDIHHGTSVKEAHTHNSSHSGFSSHLHVTVLSGILQAEEDGNRFLELETSRNIFPTALEGFTAKTVVKGKF